MILETAKKFGIAWDDPMAGVWLDFVPLARWEAVCSVCNLARHASLIRPSGCVDCIAFGVVTDA